jgi:hypothetical protein
LTVQEEEKKGLNREGSENVCKFEGWKVARFRERGILAADSRRSPQMM